MSKINCGVLNCSHNNESACYANVINVGGKSAKKDSDTCCATFTNDKLYSELTNNINGDDNECNAVTCDVGTCSFNSDSLCNAKSIKVNGEAVNLYTETDCLTFKAK